MRSGDKLCVFVGEEDISMSEYSSAEYPVDVMFDYEQSRIQDNYIKIVHEDEKYDNIDRVVCGRFFQSEKYTLCICT